MEGNRDKYEEPDQKRDGSAASAYRVYSNRILFLLRVYRSLSHSPSSALASSGMKEAYMNDIFSESILSSSGTGDGNMGWLLSASSSSCSLTFLSVFFFFFFWVPLSNSPGQLSIKC